MSRQATEINFTAIIHITDACDTGLLDSVLNQGKDLKEIILLNHTQNKLQADDIKTVKTTIIDIEKNKLSMPLNLAVANSAGSHILYIDNIDAKVRLKRSFLQTVVFAILRHPNLGMFYSDYDLIESGQTQSIRLLKHHHGRLRDNQDYGRVLVFSKRALNTVGRFDESIIYNVFYDIRLKLSVKYEIVHISNKHSGALYYVQATGKKHNVFDYLMAGKEVQLEAEKVLNSHLQRIGAYLKPGTLITYRPDDDQTEFAASVIIPVNNRPEFIESALTSVFKQTEQNIEVIVVVNGGIKDPTNREVSKYLPGGIHFKDTNPPVRLVTSDINNIGLSLNLGIRKARGKYYVQLDSDDRLKPDAVEKVVKLFESDPQIGIVIGSYEVWQLKENGEFTRMEEIPIVTHAEWTDDNGRNNLLRINGAGAPRCIPISIIKEMAYFGFNDEPYVRNYGEDYDMVLKISEKYKVGRIFDPIYEVVRHAGGTDHSIDQETIDRNDEAKDYMRLLAIQRRIQLNFQK